VKSRVLPYISSLVLITCLYLVITGSPVLNMPVFKATSFPAGTIVSWIGLIALAVTIYFIFSKIPDSFIAGGRILRFAFQCFIVLAALWGFIGFFLADNWSFTFGNKSEFRGSIEASEVFMYFTALLVLLPVLLIIIAGLMSLFFKFAKGVK